MINESWDKEIVGTSDPGRISCKINISIKTATEYFMCGITGLWQHRLYSSMLWTPYKIFPQDLNIWERQFQPFVNISVSLLVL